MLERGGVIINVDAPFEIDQVVNALEPVLAAVSGTHPAEAARTRAEVAASRVIPAG